MNVEIVYEEACKQFLIPLELTVGSSIEKAIMASGILALCPEIDLTKQKVGVFSKIRALSDLLQSGDRVEIYRPLLIDPKEARRTKAKKIR